MLRFLLTIVKLFLYDQRIGILKKKVLPMTRLAIHPNFAIVCFNQMP